MRKLLILLFVTISYATNAQEGLAPLMPETKTDSVQLATERWNLHIQPLNNPFGNDLFSAPAQLPEFDFQSELTKNWNSLINNNTGEFDYFYFSGIGFYPSPFIRDGAIFSAGEYQFSDKFKIGGMSYGANSVFSAPFPNQGLNNEFDFHGAAMFMQYKVSKNLKIETRVNVQQGR